MWEIFFQPFKLENIHYITKYEVSNIVIHFLSSPYLLTPFPALHLCHVCVYSSPPPFVLKILLISWFYFFSFLFLYDYLTFFVISKKFMQGNSSTKYSRFWSSFSPIDFLGTLNCHTEWINGQDLGLKVWENARERVECAVALHSSASLQKLSSSTNSLVSALQDMYGYSFFSSKW